MLVIAVAHAMRFRCHSPLLLRAPEQSLQIALLHRHAIVDPPRAELCLEVRYTQLEQLALAHVRRLDASDARGRAEWLGALTPL